MAKRKAGPTRARHPGRSNRSACVPTSAKVTASGMDKPVASSVASASLMIAVTYLVEIANEERKRR